MNDANQVRVRDKRKPGHCWQDNELYDTFQPVIGAPVTNVYANMTRWAYGAEVKMGLREIASESGVSRSTAQRAVLAMQAMGMIRIRRGSGVKAASYDLLDLKEAAIAHGADWHPQRNSYVLSAGKITHLRKVVNKAVGAAAVSIASVPHRDASVPREDARLISDGTLVSHGRDASVPDSGVPYISNTQDNKTTPTPTPSRREGERVSVSNGDSLLEFKQQTPSCDDGEVGESDDMGRVMRECGFSDPRLRLTIALAMSAELARRQLAQEPEANAAAIADLMIENFQAYIRQQEFMRFTWSPKKFFAQGHWLNWRGWPIDQERLDRARGAAVGSRR